MLILKYHLRDHMGFVTESDGRVLVSAALIDAPDTTFVQRREPL